MEVTNTGGFHVSALGQLTIGMSAETRIAVTRDMTIGHFVPGMPLVYATPIMILHMEMASGAAIASWLPDGFVSVGMEVNVRHLAATPVRGTVRVIARLIQIEARSVVFEVEACSDVRKIGEGVHRRGIVNVAEFERRFGVNETVPM
jgi:fluoroacetyl-CoA thioesterase